MTQSTPSQFSTPKSPRDVPTERECLRCKTVFQSDGFGERVCPRCKGSAVWKTAMPARGDGTRQR